MSSRILWPLFFATVITLGILVVGLNCLQSAAPMRWLGFLACNYGLTSSDFRVRAGATIALVLFFALILSPIMAAFRRPPLVKRSKSST